MQIPSSYASATDFPGFVNRQLKISFVVADFPPAAYAEMAKGFKIEAFAKRGVNINSIGTLAGRSDEHLYLTGGQTTADGFFGKYLLLIRSEHATALITVTVAKASLAFGDVKVGEIETILRSSVIGPEPAQSPVQFTLGYLGTLKDSGTFMAPMHVYTREGTIVPDRSAPERALFLVAPSPDNAPISDIAAFAEAGLRGRTSVQITAVTGRRSVVVAGLNGFELEATAVTGTERVPIVVYQLVLARPNGGAFILTGQARASEGKEMLAEFEKIAHSFRPVP
jgi:hypothetical protein